MATTIDLSTKNIESEIEAATSDAEKLAAELNNYEGDNFWQDVVERYDIDERSYEVSTSDHIYLADGGEVWHAHHLDLWICD